jgi:DNA invertase Pin-like site-specific DNA recombinase
LIRECEAHNISVVLTKSISRFGRDTVETLSAINRLKVAGVRIIFEEENLDTDEVDSNLMISVMESFAQAENESRSENIRMGLAMRAANGTSGLYKRKLYGYAKNECGELVIDDEQSKVVRDIFRWYLDGDSVLGIIKRLFEAGILSPTSKEQWSKRSIEKIIENEKYTGTVTLLDSATQEYEYQMKECHPPIITESEFRAVHEEKKKRSNIVTDDDGTHRSSKKYSSKKK